MMAAIQMASLLMAVPFPDVGGKVTRTALVEHSGILRRAARDGSRAALDFTIDREIYFFSAGASSAVAASALAAAVLAPS